jgi:hypothetical protein
MRITSPPITLQPWALPAIRQEPAAARALDLIADVRGTQDRKRTTLPTEQVVEGELLRESNVIPPERAAAARVFAGRASTVYDQSGNTYQAPASPRAISAYLSQDSGQGPAGANIGSRLDIFV